MRSQRRTIRQDFADRGSDIATVLIEALRTQVRCRGGLAIPRSKAILLHYGALEPSALDFDSVQFDGVGWVGVIGSRVW